jgi:outer membrane protein assembly factor BamB
VFRRRVRGGVVWAAVVAVALLVGGPGSLVAASVSNWSTYLFNVSHASRNGAATAITPANASRLVHAWTWKPDAATMPGQPGPGLLSSPTVYNGTILIGANTGVFYAVRESTGTVLWKRFFGYVTTKTLPGRGFTSTAAVALDPVTKTPTAYVAAADGYLYALDVATGRVVWRAVVGIPSMTVNDYYNWASPAVVAGRVYMGISSQGDKPLVRGGARVYNQHTGAILGTFYAMAPGTLGGSVWSSPAAEPTGTSAYVTTGNPGDRFTATPGDSNSIVRLSAATLAVQSRWAVPQSQQVYDSDFGASPTLFSARLAGTSRPMIGACNKNGIYYALRRDNLAAGPVWSLRVGAPSTTGPGLCLTAAVSDGSRLYIAANATTITGTPYNGAIRALDAATGHVIWQTGLAGTVLASPSENGTGVIAAATYQSGSQNYLYLVNAATGAVLTKTPLTSITFAQPVFADNLLLVAPIGGGLIAYTP